jgi:hypothetical protein
VEVKKYKSAGSDQIPSELIQEGDDPVASVIHTPISTIWNMEELPGL